MESSCSESATAPASSISSRGAMWCSCPMLSERSPMDVPKVAAGTGPSVGETPARLLGPGALPSSALRAASIFSSVVRSIPSNLSVLADSRNAVGRLLSNDRMLFDLCTPLPARDRNELDRDMTPLLSSARTELELPLRRMAGGGFDALLTPATTIADGVGNISSSCDAPVRLPARTRAFSDDATGSCAPASSPPTVGTARGFTASSSRSERGASFVLGPVGRGSFARRDVPAEPSALGRFPFALLCMAFVDCGSS